MGCFCWFFPSVRNEGAARSGIVRLLMMIFEEFLNIRSGRGLPIVEMNVVLKASSEKRNSTHVFPTPESPINSNLNK